MFFAIDALVKMFKLLKYGVAGILIFIGAKLILRSWIHIPPMIVCCILIGTLMLSVIASLALPRPKKGDNVEILDTNIHDEDDPRSSYPDRIGKVFKILEDDAGRSCLGIPDMYKFKDNHGEFWIHEEDVELAEA